MPYPKDHAAKTREKILASAYKLFISNGYDATALRDRLLGSSARLAATHLGLA